MKKISLIALLLLICSLRTWAQAYEFETTEESFDNGTKYVLCRTKDYAELGTYSPDIQLELQGFYDSEKIPFIYFNFHKFARGDYKNSFTVANNIRKIALSIPKYKDFDLKENVTINLYLSNGDVLYGTNIGNIANNSSIARYSMEIMDSVGSFSSLVPVARLVSSHTPKQILTLENQKLICQQLRTYDIVKIEIDGISFDTHGLHSAATFDAMFDALAKKTGKGDQYRNTDSSSSSSSQAKASAIIGDFMCGFLSTGKLLCRLTDVTITGAKDKTVEVMIVFEDKQTGVADAVTKVITPPYDSTHYDGISFSNGSVADLTTLRNNKGNYRVYAMILINPHKKDGRTVYSGSGESISKNLTVYYNGTWKSVGGGF